MPSGSPSTSSLATPASSMPSTRAGRTRPSAVSIATDTGPVSTEPTVSTRVSSISRPVARPVPEQDEARTRTTAGPASSRISPRSKRSARSRTSQPVPAPARSTASSSGSRYQARGGLAGGRLCCGRPGRASIAVRVRVVPDSAPGGTRRGGRGSSRSPSSPIAPPRPASLLTHGDSARPQNSCVRRSGGRCRHSFGRRRGGVSARRCPRRSRRRATSPTPSGRAAPCRPPRSGAPRSSCGTRRTPALRRPGPR